ncbi:unnamed protein product [Rangifer tarandus platyrhynchus]|uniref:Uncharacterized protein n=2 Tax=Rangifer tarandus platyrhynchus TaxID=3082113 RepID=A0ABN8YDH1_RANTA|nr:unnamed protein product [Rangifer tarandus platyrhynchus]CAI9699945.1 unnamed protein product [Rangifer tarandus platyrhynchus]
MDPEPQCRPSPPRRPLQSRGPRASAGQSASCSAARPGFGRAKPAPPRPEARSPALVSPRRAAPAAPPSAPSLVGAATGGAAAGGHAAVPAPDRRAPLPSPPHSTPRDSVLRREPRPLLQTLASSSHPLPAGKLRGGAGGRATSALLSTL